MTLLFTVPKVLNCLTNLWPMSLFHAPLKTPENQIFLVLWGFKGYRMWEHSS